MPDFYEDEEWGHGTAPLYGPKLNNDQFGGFYIRHSLVLPKNEAYAGNHKNHEVVALSKDHSYVGRLEWHRKTGEMLNVDVDPDYRRQGIATALLRRARDLSSKYGLVSPEHSADRTDAGQKWAESTGDPLPKRVKMEDFPEV